MKPRKRADLSGSLDSPHLLSGDYRLNTFRVVSPQVTVPSRILESQCAFVSIPLDGRG